MEFSVFAGRMARKLKERRILIPLLGVIIGGCAGFAYYYVAGCSSGSCPITSSPWGNMAIGSLGGLVLTLK